MTVALPTALPARAYGSLASAVTDLLIPSAVAHASAMFTVTEAEAAAIRQVFERDGELSAATELRRLFPGIRDNAQARECVRVIAGWKPLPLRPVGRSARSRDLA